MFEPILLLGERERSILLQTRAGRNIPNVLEPDPPAEHGQAKYRRLCQRNLALRWEERKPPTGFYNCVGHVWASRRTSVFDNLEELLLLIRQDDGYRVCNYPQEPVYAGDLVLYWESVQPYRNFLHVGIVAEMRPGITEASPRIPWILSKWDSCSGEVLHRYPDIPKEWRETFGTVAHEFWTERP